MAKAKSKPIIFISHIKEESRLAIALKELLENAFLSFVEVFVSSDPTSLPLGDKWLKKIESSLKNCVIEIVIASPSSIARPWITFEAGAGWIRDIPVIPLCHSGLTADSLPTPLSSLQAGDVKDRDLNILFGIIAQAAGCSLPAFDASTFLAVVSEFEAETAAARSLKMRPAQAEPVDDGDELSEVELEVLKNVGGYHEGCQYRELKDDVEQRGWMPIAVNLGVRMLERKGLVEIVEFEEQYDKYSVVQISPAGWRWIESNQKLISLRWSNSAKSSPNPNDEVPF